MENTNNFLNWIEIKNFKSIKDLRLDCKRVNVFIGKPNVRKSNILEALGLLGADYSRGKFMDRMIRYEEIRSLFYDNNLDYRVETNSNFGLCVLKSTSLFQENTFEFYSGDKDTIKKVLSIWSNSIDNYEERMKKIFEGEKYLTMFGLNNEGSFDKPIHMKELGKHLPSLKKYDFYNITEFDILFQDFLLPPDGRNLYAVIDKREDLKNDFGKLFIEQGLDFVLSKAHRLFELQKKEGYYVTQYPYHSIADTFRRFMFYLTAIESNTDSVIVLEEPEVHSFPPYVQTLAFRMIESTTNQFFVSTHSPYLLQTLIEHLGDEQLNVFITYYEDYQTKVRALTPEELSEVQEYSIDVFYNLRRFIPTPNA